MTMSGRSTITPVLPSLLRHRRRRPEQATLSQNVFLIKMPEPCNSKPVCIVKYRGWIVGASIALILLAIGISVAIRSNSSDTTLSFSVVNSVSGDWVWDLEARMQNRVIKGYYQSDTKPAPPFVLTRLESGEHTLELSAPHYLPQQIPVDVKRGANTIPAPIEMTGFEIPGLETIYVFESLLGADINCELRPVNLAGMAIENHPALDIWVGAEVSVQLKDGVPVTETTQEASTRGTKLFKGSLEWSWDATPETLFRYTATIPGDKIADHPAPFVVIDYLVAIRDPRLISKAEMGDVLDELWAVSDDEDFVGKLQQYNGISFYLDTSWNVERN